MKQKAWMLVCATLSFYLGIIDYLPELNAIPCTDACKALHATSMGSLLGVPIGFWATGAMLLLFAASCHGRLKHHVFDGLCLMLGADLYFVGMQVVVYRITCWLCMAYAALLVICVIAWSRSQFRLKRAWIAAPALLAVHFALYPPWVGANISGAVPVVTGGPVTVEVYASPACPHCKDAVSTLREVCIGSQQATLKVRPISLSPADRKQAVLQVCKALSEQQDDPVVWRLAEQAVFANARKARSLNNGRLEVPVVVVRDSEGKTTVYKGWSNDTKALLTAKLEGVGIGHRLFSQEPNNGFGFESEVCTTDAACME